MHSCRCQVCEKSLFIFSIDRAIRQQAGFFGWGFLSVGAGGCCWIWSLLVANVHCSLLFRVRRMRLFFFFECDSKWSPSKSISFYQKWIIWGLRGFFWRHSQIFGSLSLWSTIKSGRLCCHIWGLTLQSSKIDMTKRSSFERREQDNFSDTQMVEGQSASWTAERFAEDLSCLFARSCCWYAGCAPQKTDDDMLKEDHGILVLWVSPRSFVAFLLFWDWSIQIPRTQVVGSWGNGFFYTSAWLF